jgi:signal transduction histidine kinase
MSMTYPTPENEEQRLETLHSYKLLDTPAGEPYERLVHVAQRILEVPVAGFCLMDERRQWFKAVAGSDLEQTPRSVSFCTHAIAADDMLLVSDATQDPRFRENPLVTREPGVRSYAGVPVRGHDGTAIGTLLVLDTVPRRFTQQEQARLRLLAERLEEHIELRRLALRLKDHRDRGEIEPERAEELEALWRESGEVMKRELDELEKRIESEDRAIDDGESTTFADAVDEVVASFDMAKQMLVNFRHLGMRRDGSFELLRETFAPEALSGCLFEKFEGRFEEQGRALHVEDSTENFSLKADLGVLRRVLEHLVENAVSYSPVSTDVRVEFNADGDWLTVRVFDRGPGPNKRLGDAVFEEGTTRQTLIDSGSPGPRRGDGLSYVRAAVEAHGGIVGYEHRDPTGCVFWFCVPSNPHGLPVEH